MDLIFHIIPAFGVLALLYTFWKSRWISKQDPGNEKMQKIAKHISDGAMAFLKAEYKVLAIFVIIVAALLAFSGANSPDSSPLVAVSFIVGALCSALAGFIGMNVATKANIRTTQAARTSLGKALGVAISSCASIALSASGDRHRSGIIGSGCSATGINDPPISFASMTTTSYPRNLP